MAKAPDALTEVVQLLQLNVHALEIVTSRALAELENLRPGLLDAVSGPVIFQDRPDADFDEHLGKVDEQISRLVIWARQYRGELP